MRFKLTKGEKNALKIILYIGFLPALFVYWEDFSWIANSQALSSVIKESFVREPNEILANEVPVKANEENAKQEGGEYTTESDSIEIPKIGIKAPIIIGDTTDVKLLTKKLDTGVVLYDGYALPGQEGQSVALGHSAPANWPHIKYDWVFSDLEKLATQDVVVVNYNNRKYKYRVIGQRIVNIGQDIDFPEISGKNILTLISCWPPGKNYKRIAINAELIGPSE